MKHLLSKKLSAVVALVLVLSMVLGVAPAAFAADESDKLVDNIYGKNKQNIKDYIYDTVYGYAVEYGAIEAAIAKIDALIEQVENYKAQIPEVPDEVPEELPEDWPEEIPDEVWDELPELLDQIPPEMIEELPPELIETIPPEVIEKIPSDVLDKVPDSVLDQIPQDTIDQLPEDLRQEIMDRLGRTAAPVMFRMSPRSAEQDTSAPTNTYSEYVKYVNQLKKECDDLLNLLNEFKASLQGDDLTTWEGFVDTLHYYEEELPERIERIKFLWAVIASYVIDGVPVYDENTDPEQVRDDFIKSIELLVKIENKINNDIVPAMEDAFDAIADVAFAPTCTLLEVFLDRNVDTAEEVVEAFEEIANMTKEEIEARIKELIEEATHADYVIDDESYYVAFGNITARNSYAELLAAELDVPFANKSVDGMTVEDFAENVAAYKTEIAKADLITLNFGEIDTFVQVVNNVATSGSNYNLDWEKYLGEDYAKIKDKIDAALDRIYEELAANGVDAKMAEVFVTAVETYAYKYIVHGYNLDKAVAEIKEINPEVLIVVVGAYNPLRNTTYEYEGKVIDMGEYVNYLFKAFRANDLAYAIITADVTYVDAPAVEVMLNETELSTEMLAKITATKLLPTDAGHKYIQEQIYNALNITRNDTPLPPPPTGDITASVAVLTVLLGTGIVALVSKRKSFI